MREGRGRENRDGCYIDRATTQLLVFSLQGEEHGEDQKYLIKPKLCFAPGEMQRGAELLQFPAA